MQDDRDVEDHSYEAHNRSLHPTEPAPPAGVTGSLTVTSDVLLPPELQRWAWHLDTMTIGAAKQPAYGWTFAFSRLPGLAAGDDDLDPDDPSLTVTVHGASPEIALDKATAEMRRISAGLEPVADYEERLAAGRMG